MPESPSPPVPAHRGPAHRRLVAGLLLLLAALATRVAAAQAEPPTYEGRPIAPVMSYRGAPWLERTTREGKDRGSGAAPIRTQIRVSVRIWLSTRLPAGVSRKTARKSLYRSISV